MKTVWQIISSHPYFSIALCLILLVLFCYFVITPEGFLNWGIATFANDYTFYIDGTKYRTKIERYDQGVTEADHQYLVKKIISFRVKAIRSPEVRDSFARFAKITAEAFADKRLSASEVAQLRNFGTDVFTEQDMESTFSRSVAMILDRWFD